MKVVLNHFAESTPWQFEFARVTPDQWNTASMLLMPAPDTDWQPQPQNLHAVIDRITVERDTEDSASGGDDRKAQ
jgi:cell filamentation protein